MILNARPLLAAIVLAGLIGCMDDDDDSPSELTGNGEAKVEASRAYIDGIVPHHEMAVMMAEEALVKATHPSLKEMAQMMKDDQTEEIALFKSIRDSLVGSDTTPDPMPMKEMPAGAEFDRMFIHMMIDHHQGAIDQSLLALEAEVVSPLDSLATSTIEKQRMEQQELNDSLQAWYGETHRIGDGPHEMHH